MWRTGYFSNHQTQFIIAIRRGMKIHPEIGPGASTCQLAVILIDARYGIADHKTRRPQFYAFITGYKTQLLFALIKWI